MNHSWSECVIALYKSKIHKGIYRKMLADHTIESARNAGADFYLREDRSGVFTLGKTGNGLPVNAKHMHGRLRPDSDSQGIQQKAHNESYGTRQSDWRSYSRQHRP
ncbi:MAG TPA: hypothetical protein PLU75_06115 [Oscillospiraceae bacterium]|nr:hypothetical protein [Oscillospiraceae bacterium]HRW57689.1 hypothetical protein [Oscillospiraceae bacterium]